MTKPRKRLLPKEEMIAEALNLAREFAGSNPALVKRIDTKFNRFAYNMETSDERFPRELFGQAVYEVFP